MPYPLGEEVCSAPAEVVFDYFRFLGSLPTEKPYIRELRYCCVF